MDGGSEGFGEKRNSYQSEEDMFRFMIENSGDILWTIDLTGRWQFITSNVEKVIHIKAKDIVGRMVWDFVAPEYREILKNMLVRRIKGEDLPPYEVIVLDALGRRRPFEVKTSPIVDRSGKIIGIQGISRDITQRKNAEEALRKSEEELRKAYGELEMRVEERTLDLAQARSTLQGILNTAPIGIIVANAPEGNISYYSPGAERIFGEDVVNNVYKPSFSPGQLLTADGSPYASREMPLLISLEQGKRITDVEMQFINRDGKKMNLLIGSAPIRDEDGKIRAAVATIVDITRLKSTEKELREAKAQAELYLDLMSHDINNMNMTAMGYIEMAQDRVASDKESAILLDKSAEMLKSSTQLIDNVRKIQKAEQGDLQAEVVDLCEVVERARNRYSNWPGRNVAIDTTFPASRSCWVTANQLIEDVFANLIDNAIKHSISGKPVQINITISEDVAGNNECYIVTVEDNGPGIPDDLKSRLFIRLQRGKTKATGRGLGLYLVKTLVEDFGGSIMVEDRVKGSYREGTRFVVRLPVARTGPRRGTGACAG